MRSEVTVTFEGAAPVRIDLDRLEPMSHEAARAWLDGQFTELGCEPLRPTGKVLSADKVVVVAEAAGARSSRKPAGRRNLPGPPARCSASRWSTSTCRRSPSATEGRPRAQAQPAEEGPQFGSGKTVVSLTRSRAKLDLTSATEACLSNLPMMNREKWSRSSTCTRSR